MNRNILVSTLLLYACCMALLSCSNKKPAIFKNEQGQYLCKAGGKIYLFPYHYAGGDGVFVNGQAVAVLDGKWGVIDEQGNTVHPYNWRRDHASPPYFCRPHLTHQPQNELHRS